MGIKQSILVCLSLGLAAQLIFAFEAEDEEVIYIKSSQSAPCPAQPCYTLSQFAAINESQLQPNTTLLILSGNHSLDSTILVADITFFSMLSHLSSSPNIRCHQYASIKLHNISNVMIRGLIFYGCGENMITSVDRLTVQNSSFVGTENSGTALNVIKSNAVFVNCSFLSNRVGTYHGPIMILESQQKLPNTNFTTSAYVGGALIVNQSNVSVVGSKFEKNHAEIGGAIFSTLTSRVSVINSTFTENNVCLLKNQNEYLCFGGVFFCENANNQVEIINSEFNNNSGFYGGVFTVSNQCIIHISSSRFSSNTAEHYPRNGGVLYLQESSAATINGSVFFNNSASSQGGAVHVKHSVLIIHDSKFLNNSAGQFGGVISIINGNLTVNSSHASNNNAFQGGVLNAAPQCSVSVIDSKFTNNEAASVRDPPNAAGGVILIGDSSTLNIIRTLFYRNSARNGAVLTISSSVKLNVFNSSFIGNQASQGGVITVYQSDTNFFGLCNMTNNVVLDKGGTIYATGDSLINVQGELVIMFNKAYNSGGGVYLYRSKLNCQFNSTVKLIGNNAVRKGGGIFAINAIVKVFSNRDSSVKSSIVFEGNTAALGGGIYLELATELHVLKSGNNHTKTIYNLRFIENSASYGGAIYNADETNYEICTSKSYYNHNSVGTECFLQILAPVQTIDMKYNIVTIEFVNNSAEVSGPALYGGLLDRCTLILSAEILYTDNRILIDGVTYFLNTTTLNNTNGISSSPVQVCLCAPHNNVPDCSLQQLSISVRKGEKFYVSLVAVDQVNRTLPNITVYSSLRYAESGLGEGQMAQITTDKCTTFNFSVFSPHCHEEVMLYAESPCRNATKSQRNIHISFLHCTCPVGFQPSVIDRNNCVCKCDPKLHQYVTNCSSQTDSLIREGNFWITYLNRKLNTPNNYSYLMYPHCPLDYCLPSDSKVQINLTMINGADAQCANKRSGTLCGVCRPGLSLSLGTSSCITCSNQHLVIILLGASIAGITLVALMLILNLTVATGTLNGLIFYANIIGANSSTFFPSTSRKLKTLYVFISWLNLDIGFDVCFFKGMDTYWKTWIQLAFPTYVILLVILVILVSERSIRFTRLISKKNPVATLATLILLSYAKFLRTIITTLSYVTLVYPDGHRRMWLPDATITYLGKRHISLFIVAILILVIGVVYTFLLFSWQWLLVIKGINKYQRLNHFVEVYHAPYRFEHRYWTGLLLITRVILYLVFVFSNPSLNLLAIIVVTCGLLFLKGHFGRIYDDNKSRVVDTIEMISYLNIALFSAATFFTTQTGDYQTEAAFTSVTITFALFLFVLASHIYAELLLKWWMTLKLKINAIRSAWNASYTGSDITRPTFSIIDGIPDRNTLPSVLDHVDETTKHKVQESAYHSVDKSIVTVTTAVSEDDDSGSINSSTPLLRK